MSGADARLQLLRYEARASAPLVVGAGAVAAVVTVALVGTDMFRLLFAVQLAAAALACTVAFALDDPAARTVEAAPTGLPVRRGLRVMTAVSTAAVGWTVVLAVAGNAPVHWYALGPSDATAGGVSTYVGVGLPVVGLTLTAVACVSAALAVGSFAWRHAGPTTPGYVAGPALVLLVAAAYRLPPRSALLGIPPTSPSWRDAQLRLAAVAVVALASVIWYSRDRPAAR